MQTPLDGSYCWGSMSDPECIVATCMYFCNSELSTFDVRKEAFCCMVLLRSVLLRSLNPICHGASQTLRGDLCLSQPRQMQFHAQHSRQHLNRQKNPAMMACAIPLLHRVGLSRHHHHSPVSLDAVDHGSVCQPFNASPSSAQSPCSALSWRLGRAAT
jgi:hypothetical protein